MPKNTTPEIQDGSNPTPGAIRAAEIITGHKLGSKWRKQTEYGTKTVQGIAAIIDRHTTERLKVLATDLLLLAHQYRHDMEDNGDSSLWGPIGTLLSKCEKQAEKLNITAPEEVGTPARAALSRFGPDSLT